MTMLEELVFYVLCFCAGFFGIGFFGERSHRRYVQRQFDELADEFVKYQKTELKNKLEMRDAYVEALDSMKAQYQAAINSDGDAPTDVRH